MQGKEGKGSQTIPQLLDKEENKEGLRQQLTVSGLQITKRVSFL